jgi:hypothetical protein
MNARRFSAGDWLCQMSRFSVPRDLEVGSVSQVREQIIPNDRQGDAIDA